MSCNNDLAPDYKAPVAADGWSYRLIAQDLTSPRSVVVDPRGGLLVLDSGVGIKRLVLDDDGGTCLSVRNEQTLVSSSSVSGKEYLHSLTSD